MTCEDVVKIVVGKPEGKNLLFDLCIYDVYVRVVSCWAL
jgi:hypothetical protein